MNTFTKRLITLLVLIGTASGQSPSKLDGKWWGSLWSGQRTEFLAGFIDCYANDFGDKNNTFPKSWDTYAPRITRFYEQHPSEANRLVTSVLFEVRSKQPPKPPQGGEVWNEKHWFFDGLYWQQMGNSERTAFLEGYLSCHREYLAGRPEKFSRAATFYEKQISGWYSTTARRRERTAIADVLSKFAD